MKFNFAFRGKVEEDGIPKLKKKKRCCNNPKIVVKI